MEPSDPSLPAPAPFAPPSNPATPFAPPDVPHVVATIVPITQTRHRHRALIGGLSALTAAVVAVGAFAVLSDTPDDLIRDDAVELATDTPDRTEGFSYAAAATAARESASMSLDMSIETDEGAQTILARVDRASGRVAMDFDLSQLDQSEIEFAVGDSVGMIIDEKNNTVYLTANLLGELFGEGGEGWLSVDSDEFSDDSGGFDQVFTNPLSITDVLGDLDPVDLGPENVDGEMLRHFQVSVDGQTLAEESGTDANVFGGAVGGAIDVTYDVWVSEDDRVRRISFVADDPDSQNRASVSMDIETSAEAIDIELPDPADVTDIDELFAQIGADFEG